MQRLSTATASNARPVFYSYRSTTFKVDRASTCNPEYSPSRASANDSGLLAFLTSQPLMLVLVRQIDKVPQPVVANLIWLMLLHYRHNVGPNFP